MLFQFVLYFHNGMANNNNRKINIAPRIVIIKVTVFIDFSKLKFILRTPFN